MSLTESDENTRFALSLSRTTLGTSVFVRLSSSAVDKVMAAVAAGAMSLLYDVSHYD